MIKLELFSLRSSFKKILVVLLMASASVARADPSSAELSKLLPGKVGQFRQLQPIHPLSALSKEGMLTAEDFRAGTSHVTPAFLGGEVEYVSSSGERFTVEIVRLQKDADAYSFFTLVADKMRGVEPVQRLNLVGIASVISPRQVGFVKGSTFGRITNARPHAPYSDASLELARLLAEGIDKGEGEIPVLVQHLPGWQEAQQRATYFVSLDALKKVFAAQPVFDAVSFNGGAEAVVGNYDPQKLVIVEFNTPQIATDNDQRIVARIQELRGQGQSVPSAYRRVGNYSVFVFNAPDQQAANNLIDQVKYQQVVQWLGENPYAYEAALKEFTETTLGVFVNVVKGSGLALVSCLAVGGLLGGLLFIRRRSQQREQEAYTDAGGMVRLNLDEMTAEPHPGRLLGRGD